MRHGTTTLFAALDIATGEVIGELPLVCLHCGGQMRITSFIIDTPTVRKILDHIGEDSHPPRIAPARGPPLWDGHDAVVEADADADPQWDPSAQSAPEYQVDQRINW